MTNSKRNDALIYMQLRNKTEPYTAEDVASAKQIAEGSPSAERIGFYMSIKRLVEETPTE